jgi:hypothetical protein
MESAESLVRYRVRVLLRGQAKHEIRSPEAYTRAEAEDVIEKIHKAREDGGQVALPWLTLSGEDVLAAYSEPSPEDRARTADELRADLEKFAAYLVRTGILVPAERDCLCRSAGAHLRRQRPRRGLVRADDSRAQPVIRVAPASPRPIAVAQVSTERRSRPHTAFVLSGGGSLGALQLGMLRAVYESGIAADLLVGTSAGALNAAFVASRLQNVATANKLARVWRGLQREDIFPVSLLPGVPATGLHYVAGVSPVGLGAFVAAMALGAILRTAPYAVLGQGIGSGSLATILIAGASIAVGGLTAAVLVRRLRTPLATT